MIGDYGVQRRLWNWDKSGTQPERLRDRGGSYKYDGYAAVKFNNLHTLLVLQQSSIFSFFGEQRVMARWFGTESGTPLYYTLALA